MPVSQSPNNSPAAQPPQEHEQPRLPKTMRAVLQPRYGGPDVLSVGDVAVPSIRPGEVLVRVEAAGLDRGTWHLLYGLPLMARLESGLRRPKRNVPGFDLSGVVAAVGAEVDTFRPGDAVCGIGRGSLAGYAPALARKLARRGSLDPTAAGVLAISGLTALQAVRDKARIEAGQRVLIMGASGGVGSYAVQLAAARGAHVTGVCRESKAAMVRSLGAETTIDYTTADPLEGSARYDAIIDIGGRRPLRHLRRALVPGGVAVLVGGEGGGRLTGGFPGRMARGAALSLLGGKRLVSFVSGERGEDVAELVRLVEDGSLRPQVDRIVGLDGVAAALTDLEAGRIAGKVAVRP